MPLGTPQNLFLLLSFGGYQKAFWHLQSLRRRSQSSASYCEQAIFFHFTPRRASKRTKRKISAFFLYHPTVLITRAGGRPKQELLPIGVCEFLSLAHAKAEDVKLREKMSRARAPRPFRAAREFQEGTSWCLFFAPSLRQGKEGAINFHRTRAMKSRSVRL